MKAKQRTEITYEAHETTVIRYSRGQSTIYCRLCGTYVPGLSLDQAASILVVAAVAIERSICEGKIHAIESSGLLVLCGNSLRLLLLGENANGSCEDYETQE